MAHNLQTGGKMNRYEDIVYLFCKGVIMEFEGEPFEELVVAIPCSDTFVYASADAEEIPIGREHEVRTAYDEYGWAGVIAWCAKERGVEPLSAYVNRLGKDKYKLARSSLAPPSAGAGS